MPVTTERRLRATFDVPISLASGVVSLLLTVPILRLWNADLQVPFAYSGDANSHGMLFKAVLDHGWYERNPDLAAPFGQRFNDFPMPDNLHLAAAKVLGFASDNYAAVLNIYFLAGFGLAAAFATLALRVLGISRAVSLVLGILYAFAPYHFIRGEAQLFLASYYAVPLGVLVALGAAGHAELFPTRKGVAGVRRYVTWTGAATIAMCILVGSSSAYYGAFAVILVAVVVVGHAVASRDRKALVVGAVVAGAITLTVGANVAPDLLWARSHGSNTEAVFRAPGDTETYSLKLTQLLLPSPYHRVDAAAALTQRYLREFPIPSEPHPLGAVASFGVVYLLGIGAVTLLRGGDPPADRLPLHLSVLTIASLLAAMTGGLASLFELVFIPILRGWNRMAIFIAFLGLIAVGLLLDRLRVRWLARQPIVFGGILLLLLALGLADQTSRAFVPDYAGTAAAYRSDAEFVRDIERTLDDRSMVFQLPYVEFPEAGPTFDMVDYDHFRGYLHSDDLRWSYGGMKGRIEADWAETVATAEPSVALPQLAAVGFEGVYVDRAGYADRGAVVEAGISEVLGKPPIVSKNGRLAFFDLREFRRGLLAARPAEDVARLRREALVPVRFAFGSGFYGLEGTGATTWRWGGSEMTIDIDNTGDEVREVDIEFSAATGGPGPATLSVTLPGGETVDRTVGPPPTPVRLRTEVPPGPSRLVLRTDAAAARQANDPRDLRLQVLNFRLATAGSAR